jgi:hypothetical protein
MNPAQVANNWGPAALIVFGYIIAAFWQNKRFEDMKSWIEAKFDAVNLRLDAIEQRLDSIDKRVTKLEEQSNALVRR